MHPRRGSTPLRHEHHTRGTLSPAVTLIVPAIPADLAAKEARVQAGDDRRSIPALLQSFLRPRVLGLQFQQQRQPSPREQRSRSIQLGRVLLFFVFFQLLPRQQQEGRAGSATRSPTSAAASASAHDSHDEYRVATSAV